MNVLWVEDFGHLQADIATISNYFGDLLPRKVFLHHWDPDNTDLLENPRELQAFFERHSQTHSVSLARHYGDFCDLLSSINLLDDIDVVAIDINLTNGAPRNLTLPEGYNDPGTFHEKAGFYIYNKLIRIGFPDDHICFMTGQKGDSFVEFSKHCHEALMPMPKAFDKISEVQEFRRWLKRHSQTDYMTLRRGVIEGCKTLRDMCSQQPEKIIFNKYLGNDKPDADSIRDHLSSLMRSLPPACPEQDELSYALRLIARAIVHEWESKVDPNKSGGHKSAGNFARVMKGARNCLAHSQAMDQLEPKEVAFLFMTSMRAMFDLPREVIRFEAILLSLFDEYPKNLPDKREIEEKVKCSFIDLDKALVENCGETASRKFYELVEACDKKRIKNIDFIVVLYQMLWHQIGATKLELPHEYKSSFNQNSFGNNGEFLNELLQSTHSLSFP